MIRSLLVVVAISGSGCVIIEASRVGRTPTDKDAEMVAKRLAAKVPASIERHTQVEGWIRSNSGSGMTRGGNGTEWSSHFAVLEKPGDEANPRRLPSAAYTVILTPIRADVLAAVESTGVEVTWASPIEFRDGDQPRARFEVRYLRKERAVAGEVVGVIEPATASGGADTRYTDVKVAQREWVCK
ncbi:MAG TPA: hypothetical protein VMZ71_15295 [Gemmataceae bacterium]|nr:hypothetical protein [Gemmataceae bacterium]